MSKVFVIGGGAAGMLAAIFAARGGSEVHLFEKNEKLGKKIYITGKGRCNVTNACEAEDYFEAVLSNRKFLYSSFYGFTNQDVMDFFEDLGLPLKIERGNRVFPVSDHSSDVINALARELKHQKVHIHLNTEIKSVLEADGKFTGIRLKNGEEQHADKCIIATGGVSYPSTGSTGDGLHWAKNLGHKIKDLSPGLVPFETGESWVRELQGLSLRNIDVVIKDGKKKLYEDFGEMIFTHYGVSGPVMLSASSIVGKQLAKRPLTLSINLKPALSEEQLDHRILRDFEENKNKQFKNSVGKLFPAKLIPVIIRLSGIDPEKQVNTISKEERRNFEHLIRNFEVTLTGLRGYNEAIITRGGVSTKEVDPGTMESRLVENVYFAGEMLDLDAVTGGYNLQIAWSTGCAAGRSV